MDTKQPSQTRGCFKTWGWVFLIVLVILGGLNLLGSPDKEISATELYQEIENGKISELTITLDSSIVRGAFSDGTKFKCHVSDVNNLEKTAVAHGVKVNVNSPSIFSSWTFWFIVIVILGVIFMILVPIWLMKKQTDSFNSLNPGKDSDAPIEWVNYTGVTLDDVAGCDEAKEEVALIIRHLKDPESLTRLGGTLPKGILLIGAPGTGKTLLAKAIAGEAGVPFALMNGANFVKIFVGQGPARIRQAFAEIRKKGSCVAFLDEIDAIGKRGPSALHQEYNQTINAFLAEMDGFKSNEGIALIAATNDPFALDPALLRAGRFSKRIVLDLPDIKGREQILQVHVRKIKLAENVDLKAIARLTHDYPGSELANVVNESAILAAIRGANAVEQCDLVEAVDSVIYGPEKKSRVVSEKRRRLVAYHESGHTLVAFYQREKGVDPVRKVTIIPRAMADGITHCMPKVDDFDTVESLKAKLVVGMGGRAAEEMVLNLISPGAKGDFSECTDTATKMVCEYGMSPKVGKRVFSMRNEFLNMRGEINCSPEMHKIIDEEIKRLTDEAYEEACKIIKDHTPQLEALAKALLEKETLTGEEAEEIIKSTPI